MGVESFAAKVAQGAEWQRRGCTQAATTGTATTPAHTSRREQQSGGRSHRMAEVVAQLLELATLGAPHLDLGQSRLRDLNSGLASPADGEFIAGYLLSRSQRPFHLTASSR